MTFLRDARTPHAAFGLLERDELSLDQCAEFSGQPRFGPARPEPE
jgi:hypothetical protein